MYQPQGQHLGLSQKCYLLKVCMILKHVLFIVTTTEYSVQWIHLYNGFFNINYMAVCSDQRVVTLKPVCDVKIILQLQIPFMVRLTSQQFMWNTC